MMLDKIFPKLHQEGYKFLVISGIITLILWSISNFFGFIFALITIWVYYFFRDPERISINDENYLVSPADGVVSSISDVINFALSASVLATIIVGTPQTSAASLAALRLRICIFVGINTFPPI